MKRILIIATGGTIASTADGRGLSPTLTGRELAEQVPLIDGLCELDFVQPMNIDSTNMMPADWLEMARIIREGYASYDGFVILHGTDTMAYTAAALSYLVQGSAKPIVLTGSQQPMANPFTDAKLNLYQSLVYALDDASSDVSVVFGGKAICGTHAHKQRTMSANAFTSINFPDLAMLRGDRIIRGVGLPMARTSEPAFFDALDERVCVLKLTPGLSPAIFETLKPAYDAVILETFGRFGAHRGHHDPGARGGPRPGHLRGRPRLCGAPGHPARRRHDHRGARRQDHVGARPDPRSRRAGTALHGAGQPRPHELGHPPKATATFSEFRV